MPSKADARASCLIAEADPFIANLLLRFAEGRGIDCVRAGADEDVVELARRLKPEVVIIDAELPGELIGWEIMRALKSDDATRHIALISCAWLSESEVRSLVGEVAGHLQKPDFSYSDFEQALRAAGIFTVERRAVGLLPLPSGTGEVPLIDSQTKGQRL
ncbi:MAG: response regulator [Thermoflexales bacterium]|nr:response regulator [Thermoflexales bacterium]